MISPHSSCPGQIIRDDQASWLPDPEAGTPCRALLITRVFLGGETPVLLTEQDAILLWNTVSLNLAILCLHRLKRDEEIVFNRRFTVATVDEGSLEVRRQMSNAACISFYAHPLQNVAAPGRHFPDFVPRLCPPLSGSRCTGSSFSLLRRSPPPPHPGMMYACFHPS